MKKIALLSLVFVMLLSLFACGQTNDADVPSATESKAEATESQAEATVNKFEQFEQGLTEKAIKFEKNEKAAVLVGAKEGYGYIFEDGTAVELYLFDKDSDAYKEAVKNNQINLESFGVTMDVVFNDDICIYFNDVPGAKADIEEVFSNLK